MTARQDRQADGVHAFVDGNPRDLRRALAQPGIDDFGAGIAQAQRDHFRADVVAVETGLRDQDAFAAQRVRESFSGTHRRTGSGNSPHSALRQLTISPTV